ncbi:MAG: hypothetical protein JNM94_17670 [Phycisphaerae bacterium]|nr:hypothetical protein [Phycisphaerae bacterium]
MPFAFVRVGSIARACSVVSVLALSGGANAEFSITSATCSISISDGCSESGSPVVGAPCDFVCEGNTRAYAEFANVSVTLTPISIEATGGTDVITFSGKTPATASMHYRIDFTVDVPTAFYANWNIFFPPSTTNFIPTQPPSVDEYVGTLEPGAYFIEGTCDVSGSDFCANGLLFRVIPDFFADCDNDGTFDWREIADGTQQDNDFDGVPDDCVVTNPADLDGNGSVGPTDLGILLGGWGPNGGAGDLDGDGDVDPTDLGILLGAWG